MTLVFRIPLSAHGVRARHGGTAKIAARVPPFPAGPREAPTWNGTMPHLIASGEQAIASCDHPL
ncbi:hypothetical protein [Acetobacter pasteurianus]|uniref:hypothetical protein n=1 Tax=Acetobacter pasteurianus TaxID=438 RepID=UPI000F57B4DF|nr:hypothetical protein [Acetobacter pasteurianus]